MCKMSEAPDDLRAYCRLSDYLIPLIEHSHDLGLQFSRDIVDRVRRRDFFPFITEIILEPSHIKSLTGRLVNSRTCQNIGELVKKEILDIWTSDKKTYVDVVESSDEFDVVEDLFCLAVKIGYGKGGKNPVTNGCTTFFKPRELNAGSGWDVGPLAQTSVSRLLPSEFEETYIRIFCRYNKQSAIVHDLFEKWCNKEKRLSNETQPSAETKKHYITIENSVCNTPKFKQQKIQ